MLGEEAAELRHDFYARERHSRADPEPADEPYPGTYFNFPIVAK